MPSSRRLEREAQRNIEVMWLTGRLAPDHKTIASFRRDNGPAIQAACRQVVMLCRDLQLFAGATVAVDGSKFKAVNNRDRNYTVAKVAKRLEQVEASLARYLAALDRSDREGNDVPEARTQRIGEKIAALRRQMAFLRDMQEQVEAADDGQVSLTDPDARMMATSGRGTGIVGYNVQIAVDPAHHLVVAHEVVDEGHDRTQLVPMGGRAKQAIGAKEVTVLADHYACPAGAVLTESNARSDRHGDGDHDRNLNACHGCAMRARCTTEKFKRFKRWKHEAVLEAMQGRLDAMPDAMAARRATVEHVFGTLKAWICRPS